MKKLLLIAVLLFTLPVYAKDFAVENSSATLLNVTGAGNIFLVPSGGSVGIGTVVLSQILTVAGNANITGNLYASGLYGNAENVTGLSVMSTNVSILYGANRSNTDQFLPARVSEEGNLMFSIQEGTGTGWDSVGGSTYLSSSANRVGIGTTSPSAGLQINMTNPTLWTNGTAIFDGNVGIGTTNPGSKLHIAADDATTNTVTTLLTLTHTSTTSPSAGGFGSGIDFVNEANSGVSTPTIASIQAYFATPGNGNSGIIDFRTSDSGAAPASRMVIDNLGNVGINTTNPTERLHIDSSDRQIIRLSNNGVFKGAIGIDNLNYYTGGTSGDLIISAANNIRFGSSSSTGEKLFINTSSGYVGIGTTAPLAKLEIMGSGTYGTPTYTPIPATDAVIYSSEMTDNNYHSILQLLSVRQSLTTGSGANGYLGFGTYDDSNGEGIVDAGRIAIVNENGGSRNSATALSFWTNGGGVYNNASTEKMRITSAGNVGIGVTSPLRQLVVASSVTATDFSTPIARFSGNVYGLGRFYGIGFDYDPSHTNQPVALGYIPTNGAGYTEGALAFATRSGTTDVAPTERMRIDSTGNVGIGTTSPATRTEINGTLRLNNWSISSGAGTEVGTIEFTKCHGSGCGVATYNQAELRAFTNGGYAGGLKFYTSKSIGGGNYASTLAMTIDENQNIGIGTTTPQSTLDVRGTLRIVGTSGQITMNDTDEGNAIRLERDSGGFNVDLVSSNTNLFRVADNGLTTIALSTAGKGITMTQSDTTCVTDAWTTIYTLSAHEHGLYFFTGDNYGGSALLFLHANQDGTTSYLSVLAQGGDVSGYTWSFQLAGTDNRQLQAHHQYTWCINPKLVKIGGI